jgi:prepilin-type N-terminal cleavage/methylation domain-containing protein
MLPRARTRNIYGFTLVELIVTITILVILGTIAFVSLGGYAGSARDGSRVSDLSLIAKGLDLFYIKQ